MNRERRRHLLCMEIAGPVTIGAAIAVGILDAVHVPVWGAVLATLAGAGFCLYHLGASVALSRRDRAVVAAGGEERRRHAAAYRAACVTLYRGDTYPPVGRDQIACAIADAVGAALDPPTPGADPLAENMRNGEI